MFRTFTVLAALLTLLMLTTFGLGWASFFMRPDPLDTLAQSAKKDLFLWHFYLGLTSAILILLVHCLIFMYFLGTGRWVKEVTLAYQIPDEPLHKGTRELKRRAYPPALFAMLIGIATSAAGAGAQLQAWPWYVHATLAVMTLLINFWAFGVEFRCLRENVVILDAVLDEVDRIRLARGLSSNADALAQGSD